MILKIEWPTDTSDCECCGLNFNTGLQMYIDGQLIYNKEAIAMCYGNYDSDYEEALIVLCKYFNIDIKDDCLRYTSDKIILERDKQ